MTLVSLGEIVDIKGGGTPDKSIASYWGGPIPWASVKDFKTTEISRTVDTITEEGVANSATNIIPANSILVPTRMAVGKAAVNAVAMAINQDLKALSPKDHVDLRYLLHALLAKAPDLERQATGATVKGITLEVLRSLSLPLPPLDEQKRIAAILDQADELRRKRRRAIDRLNQLGQAIFHEMFGGAANYPTASLKSLGKVSTGSTPPTSDASSFGGKVPFITPGDLGSDEDVKRTLTESGAAKSRLVEAGAAFVCCIGATIGKMDQATERSAFNQQINAVDWSVEIDPTFGFFAIQQIRDVIIHKGNGASTTLPILKKSEFEKLEVIVPPLSKQRQFATRIIQIRKNRGDTSSHNARLETLFASLQYRAFQGKL